MNYWTSLSIEFANQRNYLDELYRVYPISPNLRREIDVDIWADIENNFNNNNNLELVRSLLRLDLFPIKDSYVAYLKRDPSSILRNPNTINRIAANLYDLGIDEIYNKSTEPKETNRQIGPMFTNWLRRNTLGGRIVTTARELLEADDNVIFDASDNEMKSFAERYLGYTHDKGIDFIAKYNNTYVVAEAKFLTDFGGHQNAQFADAVTTVRAAFDATAIGSQVVPIAILDGVLYIEGRNKMYRFLEDNNEVIIISALLLREFLFSL